MKVNLVLFIQILFAYAYLVESNESSKTVYYFDENSCVTKLPNNELDQTSSDLNNVPFEIKLSSLEYSLNSNQILGVELRSSNPIEYPINGFMLQAILDDQVVGEWNLNYVDSAKTIDCKTSHDTLIGGKTSEKFGWKLTESSQANTDYSILFV